MKTRDVVSVDSVCTESISDFPRIGAGGVIRVMLKTA